MGHGSGGLLMHELINDLFVTHFANPMLDLHDDQARIEPPYERIAFTTDSFVIEPLFFPGGDIGRLAVSGTVNDLVVGGARPRYLSLAMIIEEGFSMADLEKITLSIKQAAEEDEVSIVTGDTKVVNRGLMDKLFINTAGIGFIPKDIDISAKHIKAGDKVIVSGSIGDHGMAIMAARENITFDRPLCSDLASLNPLVRSILSFDNGIHAMRDPTRGGVGTTLNEFAQQCHIGIVIEEDLIPIKEDVKSACDLFGLDPLYSPCEGRLVAFVHPDYAESILSIMRKNALGLEAAIIGDVTSNHPGLVRMKTSLGGLRIVDMLVGEQLPRIC
jgi:hydrogenase expression/formation protein HypE